MLPFISKGPFKYEKKVSIELTSSVNIFFRLENNREGLTEWSIMGLYSQVVFQSRPEVDSIGNGKERNNDDVENDEDDYDNNNNDDDDVNLPFL